MYNILWHEGKHFINETDDLVVRLLRSLLVNDKSLRLIPEKKGKPQLLVVVFLPYRADTVSG